MDGEMMDDEIYEPTMKVWTIRIEHAGMYANRVIQYDAKEAELEGKSEEKIIKMLGDQMADVLDDLIREIKRGELVKPL